MSRTLIGVVLGVLIGVPLPAEEEKDKPKDKPAIPSEKIDAKVDRSLTGFVEKINAKDEKTGTLMLRTDRDIPRYRFEINDKTKILTAGNEPLEGGLKSPLLK